MNESNVKALAEPYRQVLTKLGPAQINNADAAARYMAARGVLVPSALTDEDAARLGSAWPATTQQVLGSAVRGQLERIAKGET